MIKMALQKEERFLGISPLNSFNSSDLRAGGTHNETFLVAALGNKGNLLIILCGNKKVQCGSNS